MFGLKRFFGPARDALLAIVDSHVLYHPCLVCADPCQRSGSAVLVVRGWYTCSADDVVGRVRAERWVCDSKWRKRMSENERTTVRCIAHIHAKSPQQHMVVGSGQRIQTAVGRIGGAMARESIGQQKVAVMVTNVAAP